MVSDAEIRRRTLLAGAALQVASPLLAHAAARKPSVLIKTGRGAIMVELEAERAPITAANFLHYVDAGKYDGGTFYRASRTPGSPHEGTIVGTDALKAHPFPPIAHESTTKTGLRHTDGTISLGRFAPGSATATFFICVGAQPYLDAHPGAPGDNLGFAAFGQVIQGMATVRQILSLPAHGHAPTKDQQGQWLTKPVPILSMARTT